MDDQHPIASPPRLADAALAALGGRLNRGDFRTIGPADYARIRAALERLKQLESYLG
jgi:glutathione S-transferase